MKLIFDMGGTRTRFAKVIDGKIEDVVRLETDRSGRGLARLVAAIKEYSGHDLVEAIVGGMPGERVGKDGELRMVPNLPNWEGLPVTSIFRQSFGNRSSIYNDVLLGGIGEAWYGAGIQSGVMAYFTVSTGLNGVRIVDGKADGTIPWYELGYSIIQHDQRDIFSWESLVGGAALERQLGIRPRDVEDTMVWEERARHLAIGIYNTCLYWAPELIVFGGSMMRDIDLEVVGRELLRLPPALFRQPRLVKAKLGDETGLHGALALLRLG